MTDLQRGLKLLSDRAGAYEKAEKYYEGTADERFSNELLAALLGQNKYELNFAATPVDVLAARIEVAAVTVTGDEGQTGILQENIWDENDLTLETKEIILRALEYGDAYAIVWPNADGTGVTVRYNSPKGTALIYSEEDSRTPAYGIKTWMQDGLWRANLYYADRIEKYITIDRAGTSQMPKAMDDQWVEFVEEDGSWPIPNPFGEIPVFHFSWKGRPYGTPVHKNAYGPQDAITKLASTHMGTVDYQGAPQRYVVMGDDKSDVEGLGDFSFQFGNDPTPTEPTQDVVRNNKNASGPGTILKFDGAKSVGEFGEASPSVFMDPINFYVRAMAQTTTTPLHYFDPSGDTPSGESLRVADAPLVKNANDGKLGFQRPLSKLLSFAMKVLGFDAHVDVRWTSSQTTDDLDSWQVVQAKLDAGIPKRQAFLEAGYTDDQLDEWGITNDPTAAPEPQVPEQFDN